MMNGLLLVVIAALSNLVYAQEPKVDYNFFRQLITCGKTSRDSIVLQSKLTRIYILENFI